jgi:hypothetical protein
MRHNLSLDVGAELDRDEKFEQAKQAMLARAAEERKREVAQKKAEAEPVPRAPAVSAPQAAMPAAPRKTDWRSTAVVIGVLLAVALIYIFAMR